MVSEELAVSIFSTETLSYSFLYLEDGHSRFLQYSERLSHDCILSHCRKQ